MIKVFVDGKEGTTGLEIAGYLDKREDIALIVLPEELRKDAVARRDAIFASDITVLCLPDAAAIEAVALADGSNTKIIDASTAHRTAKGWAYGFPELGKEFERRIIDGNRVAVPGCHASGFLALVYPLIKCGFLPKDYPLVCTSLTGYSGGGKKTIAEYQSGQRSVLLDSPRLYALTQNHKHLKEMTTIAGLAQTPVFCPVIGDFYRGMEVFVPLYTRLLSKRVTPSDLYGIYNDYYGGQSLIRVTANGSSDSQKDDYLAANLLAGDNGITIVTAGNDDRLVACAVYDNLKKGAAGAAVECLNLMMGEKKEKGLI